MASGMVIVWSAGTTRARLRVFVKLIWQLPDWRMVKRILRKNGYPPDKQEKATQTVLEQAEVLSAGWAA